MQVRRKMHARGQVFVWGRATRSSQRSEAPLALARQPSAER